MEFYQKHCKSDRISLEFFDFKDDETVVVRKTGRAAHMTEADQKRVGVEKWSVSCPYRRFNVRPEGIMSCHRYLPDGTKKFDPPETLWVDTGIDITTSGKFLKTSFCSYEETDELAQDSVMDYSLYDCMRRWNARYSLYEEESDVLYRAPMNYVANGIVDDAGIYAAREITFGLIGLRKQMQEAAPQLPFSVIADATYEPFMKAITAAPYEEIMESKRQTKIKMDKALMSSLFYPPRKEPRTYEEMMEYLRKY